MDNLSTVLNEFEQSTLDLESNLEQTILKLVALSADIPHPAQGKTLTRWRALSQVAATNLNLVKWFESHLDALSILNELHYFQPAAGLWAVWAAEGSPTPIQFDRGLCTGLKNWCSGAGVVQHGLVSYKDQQQASQLLIIEMNQAGIRIDNGAWQAIGMQHSMTGSIDLDQVKAKKVGAPNQYLSRAGFWHGAAGVAACWFGATMRIADSLIQACKNQNNDFKAMYLGEVMTAVAVTKAYFHQLAIQIDAEPDLSHEFAVRVLRAQAEQTALLVLNRVGLALGARPFCENKIFAQLSADLPVFLRQSHAAFDLKNIGELAISQDSDQWML